MTSIILAQKLLSLNITKDEFAIVRRLKTNNIENKLQIVPDLKKAIKQQLKKKSCRICLRPGIRKIFGNQEFDFVTSIKNVLQIEVIEDDGKPQHICVSCETTLKDAQQLKQTAEVTQWRLQQEFELVTSSLLEQDESNLHGGYFMKKDRTLTRAWRCRKCRRTFDNQETFAEHDKQLKCGSQSRCFVCESCGIEIKSLARLKRHRSIHTGELEFSCSTCPYRGRTKYSLLVHERIHSGVRPLACTLCPATFLNSSNLASHRKRHLPPTHHCQLCPKSFKFKEALNNHQASQHGTAKPHICNTCGKTFSTRKTICRHERRVHNRPKMRPGSLPAYLRQQDST